VTLLNGTNFVFEESDKNLYIENLIITNVQTPRLIFECNNLTIDNIEINNINLLSTQNSTDKYHEFTTVKTQVFLIKRMKISNCQLNNTIILNIFYLTILNITEFLEFSNSIFKKSILIQFNS
jgi:hypothetical protein